MQDLQEDGEMRSKINLYRNDTATGSAVTGLAAATTTRSGTSEDTKMKGGGVLGSDDESDLEDDFPEIQLSELLDDMSLGGGAVHGEVHVHSNGKVAASSQVGGNVAASSRPSAIARHQATAEGEVFMGKTNWAHSKGVKDDILAGVNFTGVQGRDGVDQALEDPEFDDDL